MLTLHLTLDNNQITVHADGRESHSFSLLELGQTDKEWKDFFKSPRPYGGKLFQALFKDGSIAREAYNELSKQTERTIVLVLESSELDGIAWEYAYHDNAYIVEDFAFMRALPEKERPHANGRLSKGVERVPLLFIPANPLVDLSGEPMRELDIESEWREITQHIIKSNAPFDLIELRPATPAALQSVMARFQNGVIAHFSGHGAATKDGAFLLFENENGSSNPLEAREFVREVKDQAWIGFLSACQSAVAERTEFGNLARELVRAGVPFALGMQFNLPDPFALNISGQFYNYLSQGHAVPEAARQARRAVKRENEFYVGMIALYAAHPNEAGKMEWSGSGARTLSTFAEADVSDLPTPSGFIGRQRELMNIGTSLLGKKKPNTVTLHGAGGIGKTALMRQALLRFAPSFEATLAIALDPLPSLESVLGRLERFLNLPSPCSNDTKERERIVREKLTSKRTLLGLDNFETLNYALNDKGSDEEKTAKSLHSFFKYLVANGVTLCVTSREVTNLGGELIIDIEGLPNNAGGRLFQDNVIRQKEKIYIDKTQQVSEMVGGHPLALRLLASAFDDQIETSLDQYIEDLQSHLPKARDKWTEEDRHESLRASFNFTMTNLLKTEEGKKLQIALSRLSVFIAFFVDQTAAPVLEGKMFDSDEGETIMRKSASGMLQTLWEHGLLERRTVGTEKRNYYLYRLSPVLKYFAAELLDDIEMVKSNYWNSMRDFARKAEDRVSRSPLVAQIASNAIPDLVCVAEAKNDTEAALIQLYVGKLLRHFGLYDDALHLFDISRKSSESLNNMRVLAGAMHEKAYVLRMRGHLDEALMLYQQTLEIHERVGDPREISSTVSMMTDILYLRGDLDGAMKLYQQSLEIDEGLGNLHGQSIQLHKIADIFVTRGDLDKAMKLYQQSLEIKNKLGNLQDKAVTLSAIANILVIRGELDEAMKLYHQSLEIDEDLGNLHGKSVQLHKIASILVTRGDLDEAMKLYSQLGEIVEVQGDLEGKSAILYAMAHILDVRGDLDGAMKLYQQSFEINERLGQPEGKGSILRGMAHILRVRGDLDEAMKLYQQSLGIDKSLGDLEGEFATILAMANILVAREDLDGAMKLYQQSSEINDSLSNLKGKSATLDGMAAIYAARGDLDEAIKLYQASIAINERLRNVVGKSATLTNMGTVLFRNKQYPLALRSFFDALTPLEHVGAQRQLQTVKNLLIAFRQIVGVEKFTVIWQNEIEQPIPGWITQQMKFE